MIRGGAGQRSGITLSDDASPGTVNIPAPAISTSPGQANIKYIRHTTPNVCIVDEVSKIQPCVTRTILQSENGETAQNKIQFLLSVRRMLS